MGDNACCGTCEAFAGKDIAPIERKPIDGAPAHFKIVVSERGGETVEYLPAKPDITIGRVTGNDIVLPKGNVSKRTARIAFRDGKVIVADLKSTCGTYVDGRLITSPMVLGEGSKVYIGDFVLEVRRI